MVQEDTPESVLAELQDVELAGDEYRRDGVAFASRTGDGAFEIHLGMDVADAARRTPDTHASSRGDEWVLFAPREWDDHARDRLVAWCRVAWRMAERH